MKKLILYFLTSLACISITLVNIFAGGDNKLEVLSDGTVLRYVPSDNIEEILEKYENLVKEISARNFFTDIHNYNYYIINCNNKKLKLDVIVKDINSVIRI